MNKSQKSSSSSHKHKKYQEIPFQVDSLLIQTREKLIELIRQEEISIAMAAKEVGINYSTAKSILSKYSNTGHITKRKRQKQTTTRQTQSEPLESRQNISDRALTPEQNHATQIDETRQIPSHRQQTPSIPCFFQHPPMLIFPFVYPPPSNFLMWPHPLNSFYPK